MFRRKENDNNDSLKFVADDIAEMRDRFARVIGEEERIGERFREAERRAVFDWAEDCDDWFGPSYY